ncbi:hypothetical protein AK830_g7708 [Neonectria ditissima]|uniref:Heterokaryon incompatibility domain-containing protein n=1 Tax=Neonectria ditissima TaxID=78410 RepID=A0A0P7BE72_9HYPO|nr:hypothetical protein AK830_g7708 [Neonectria ditissima]
MILRHLSRQRPLQSLAYGRRAFQRPFQWRGPVLMRENDTPTPETIGERIRRKAKEFVQGLFGIVVLGGIINSIPSWDETLDAICRVVPPKIVASPVPSSPLNTYGPSHQDPPDHQPIISPDEFRVVIVEPGLDEETICCRIVNVTKSWRTRYDALSYTWGDESIRETIIVDGLRTSITKNLHSALVRLRDPVLPRVLWVDTLCINQDDSSERDEQVRRMGSTYSAARKVIVWLGEQTEDVQGAFSIIEPTNSLKSHRSSPKFASGDWSPVFNLLRRPWFQRTWIIQEAVLAQNPVLVCGLEVMPWKAVSTFCDSDEFQDVLPDNDSAITQALRAVDMITHGRYECHTKFTYTGRGKKRKKHEYTPDFKLMSTLYETRGFQCKDERDKVFGVLSMVTNVGPDDEVLRPNYRASVEEVLETVAQWDITKNESLELLSYCSRSAWTHPDLPSWVPDFSDMDDAHAISFLHRQAQRKVKSPRKANAGLQGKNRPFFDRENGKTVLVLSGEVIDTIARVGTVTESPKMVVYSYSDPSKANDNSASLDMTAVSKRREWFSECVRIAAAADPVLRDERRSTAEFWKSSTLGLSRYQINHFDKTMSFLAVRKQLLGGIRDYVEFLYNAVDTDPHWYQQWRTTREHKGCDGVDRCFRRLCHKRRFCATRTGRLGWVPGDTMEGDVLCLVSGAQVPIILRRQLAGVDRYKVVGDAYIDGLMLCSGDDVHVGGERLAIE